VTALKYKAEYSIKASVVRKHPANLIQKDVVASKILIQVCGLCSTSAKHFVIHMAGSIPVMVTSAQASSPKWVRVV
jgi:hypothetical protein